MKSTPYLILLLLLLQHVAKASLPRYGIVITEIMAIPNPNTNLPDYKYIELHNRSVEAVSLQGYYFLDGETSAIIRDDFVLTPGAFVIICPVAAAEALFVYGDVIAVTRFPSLRVNGDIVSLYTPDGLLMHTVSYMRTWYNNEVKQQGGWSLEMKDTQQPCIGAENWTASNHSDGGTPGQQNSVQQLLTEIPEPRPMYAYSNTDSTVTIRFSHTIDSSYAGALHFYSISNNISIEAVSIQAPLFNELKIKTAQHITAGQVYQIDLKSWRDCVGNSYSNTSLNFGRFVPVTPNTLVFSELLFNPNDVGAEYVELFNNTDNTYNLSEFYLTTRNSSGNLNTLRKLSEADRPFLPQQYLVFTVSPEAVSRAYLTPHPENLVAFGLPALNNTAGHLVLLNQQGDIIEEVAYEEKWHFSLISNYKGVALERINFNQPAQDAANWHSASSSSGYGTPTAANSQQNGMPELDQAIQLSHKTFSPDNDGMDDLLFINYRFPEPGYVCTITVYDAQGRTVRHIARNAICGINGQFRWDGLNNNLQPVGSGLYGVVTAFFSLSGKTSVVRNTVGLTRRF